MKTNNITDYASREIFGRHQVSSIEATYLFECEDHTNLEAVSFLLRGGVVTNRFLVPRDLFTESNDMIYHGSTTSTALYSGF